MSRQCGSNIRPGCIAVAVKRQELWQTNTLQGIIIKGEMLGRQEWEKKGLLSLLSQFNGVDEELVICFILANL